LDFSRWLLARRIKSEYNGSLKGKRIVVISKDEIEAKSEEFGIHVSNVERDYVFGWLLVGIYSGPLGERLVLKGGNCFRKAYFPHTRFSNDLDFSVSTAIDQQYLADILLAYLSS
jgi:predicted nucleotidyltransferase component of viral defense system